MANTSEDKSPNFLRESVIGEINKTNAPSIMDLFPAMNPFYGTMKKEQTDKFMEPLLDTTNVEISSQRMEMLESYGKFSEAMSTVPSEEEIMARRKMILYRK